MRRSHRDRIGGNELFPQSLQHVDLPSDWKPAPTYPGLYIARDSRAFERRGLDVRVVEGHGYSRAEDRIDAPRDLIGKKVGLMPGSVTVDEYRALLVANRIDRAKVKKIEVDWNGNALLDRRVDEEIAPAELQAQGRRIAVLHFAEFGLRLYSLNLIVNELAWMSPAPRYPPARAADRQPDPT